MSTPIGTDLSRAAQFLKSSAGMDPASSDISAQLETLRADMARLVETVTALGRARSGDAVASLSETAHDLRRRGEENLAAARDRGEAAMDQAAEYVRRRPTEAVAVAAGLGVLLGLFLNRR